MFRQEEQERIPEALAKIFKKLEQDLFDDIVKRISISKEISRTTDYELYRLAQLRSYDYDLKERIRQALDESNKTIDSMFDKVIEEGYAHDKSLYEDAGLSFTPLNENPVMLQLMKAVKEATKDEIENMSQTVGFLTENFGKSQFEDATTYFRNKLNETMLAMATGTYSYDAALKKTVTELCNSGIRTVSYESGRHDRVDVAVRRATLTGLAKITGKIAEQNAEALKTDYFEVSAHPTARPSHMLWQGRVYTKEQLVTVCGLGDVTGLCGANCYHHYDAFIPGISKRAYTDEQLNKMYEDSLVSKEFNGKKYTLYEATQYQRALERSMRVQDEKIRLLKQGDGSHEDLMIMKMRRRNTYETYKKLSKEFGLPEHMNRVFIQNKIKSPAPVKKTGFTSEPKESSSIEDVTNEYLSIKKSGISSEDEGKLLLQDGYDQKSHEYEIGIGKWAIEKFGGKVELLRENGKEKMPDSIWNDKLWEYKNPSSLNAISKRLEEGITQIKKNPGGVIVDLANDKLADLDYEKVIKNRLFFSAKFDMEVIVKRGSEVLKAFRFKYKK